MYIYKVGVVGAGAMGAQIAQAISFAGIPARLTDVTDALAQRGLETVRRIYQFRVDKGKMTPEQLEEKMLLVTAGGGLSALTDADVVIEAAPEDLRLKQSLFRALDRVCSPGAILASNTSALSISALGAATTRPGKVLGVHFFNPVYAMPLVEIIPGLATDQQTVDDAVGFAESLRKAPIVVKECAGFLVNRLLLPYLNEAVLCLQEGVASRQEMDQAMLAFGMPSGPFALLDHIGLDVSRHAARILHESYGPRMTPAVLLDTLVTAGRLGVKTGHGFYDYDGTGTEDFERLLAQTRPATGQATTPWTPTRLLLAMVNEAVTALQEGVASARDIDLAMVAGTGFPQEINGPLHYADQVGLDQILHNLDALARAGHPRFWPAPMLRRMVNAGLTGQRTGRGFFTYGGPL